MQLGETKMKTIQCKNCQKLFVVADRDYLTGKPSIAEQTQLCGDCK